MRLQPKHAKISISYSEDSVWTGEYHNENIAHFIGHCPPQFHFTCRWVRDTCMFGKRGGGSVKNRGGRSARQHNRQQFEAGKMAALAAFRCGEDHGGGPVALSGVGRAPGSRGPPSACPCARPPRRPGSGGEARGQVWVGIGAARRTAETKCCEVRA